MSRLANVRFGKRTFDEWKAQLDLVLRPAILSSGEKQPDVSKAPTVGEVITLLEEGWEHERNHSVEIAFIHLDLAEGHRSPDFFRDTEHQGGPRCRVAREAFRLLLTHHFLHSIVGNGKDVIRLEQGGFLGAFLLFLGRNSNMPQNSRPKDEDDYSQMQWRTCWLVSRLAQLCIDQSYSIHPLDEEERSRMAIMYGPDLISALVQGGMVDEMLRYKTPSLSEDMVGRLLEEAKDAAKSDSWIGAAEKGLMVGYVIAALSTGGKIKLPDPA